MLPIFNIHFKIDMKGYVNSFKKFRISTADFSPSPHSPEGGWVPQQKRLKNTTVNQESYLQRNKTL